MRWLDRARFGCLVLTAWIFTCCALVRADDATKGAYVGVGAYTDLGYTCSLLLFGGEIDKPLGERVLLSLDGNYSPTGKDCNGFVPFRTFSVATTGDVYLRFGALLVGGGVAWSVTKEESYFKGVMRPEVGLGVSGEIAPNVDGRLVGKWLFDDLDNFNHLGGPYAECRLDVGISSAAAFRVGAKVYRLHFTDSNGDRQRAVAMQMHLGASWR